MIATPTPHPPQPAAGPRVTTLVIATRNPHKVQEIAHVLGSRFRFLSLRDFPSAPPIEETGTTFAENARIKSETLANWLLLRRGTNHTQSWAVLGDDSGLEVDALQGDPGVLSARFAAAETGVSGNALDSANNEKLLRLLADVVPEHRTARFRCALAYTEVSSNLPTRIFQGTCEGRILAAGRGHAGFGYDPLFVPDGCESTFAELGMPVKNEISHRARALAALRAGLGVA